MDDLTIRAAWHPHNLRAFATSAETPVQRVYDRLITIDTPVEWIVPVEWLQTINRSALGVKPAQPFLDWLHRVDRTSAHLTLAELRPEPTIYLLPECDTEEEALQHLAEVSNEIFEDQLNGWYRVPSVWPDTRDLKTLLLWFDCSFHSLIVDVRDERLRHTEM